MIQPQQPPFTVSLDLPVSWAEAVLERQLTDEEKRTISHIDMSEYEEGKPETVKIVYKRPEYLVRIMSQ